MIGAGDLRHRVTVQSLTEVSDGHDGLSSSWGDTARTRLAARVRPLAGRDLERARQVDARASHEVTLRFWARYATDLAGGRSRLVFHDGAVGDRVLELIEPPREIEPRQFLACVTREAA